MLLINIQLKPIFTLLAFSLSYFGLPFFQCLSPYFHNFHLLLYYLLFLLNNNLFIVFQTSFTRDWFTCFIDAIVYFPSIAEQFVTIISPELSVLFLNKFFLTTIFNANVWLHVTHIGLLIFRGVLTAVTSGTSSVSSISYKPLNVLSLCWSSTFNLGSFLPSMAFSELSFILLTPNFQVFFFSSYFLMFHIHLSEQHCLDSHTPSLFLNILPQYSYHSSVCSF